ncbi:hypothetical protein J7376_04730 [Paracoccus sp. R12_1]|uniref:hypothetical protein n=1 Tax=unclassified Paracoccus (in: a-proteobacteria) TaxID=2688777 RepID=UPI001ADC4D1A|nr:MULTISPECIES: hypothetical protein [unclassified Paracoccus (in: a-proteobacteria)]MBO9455337.1 hypothetical protein [Paracoccus sp. R12_2]MBO9485817.1 hypothetical protein [Paracoccus sp. R12_1]|tara:strand:+ start:3605 stop:4531 length:927 start_codon:yes stop_codon:yes gene_type:complete
MHLEYAVEPEALTANWERFRYLIEKFGFDKGRLISRFPKKWEASVYELVKKSDMSDGEKKKAVEKLRMAKHVAVVRSGRLYQPEISWLLNAAQQPVGSEFHAILASENPNNFNNVIVASELDDGHPLFTVSTSINVPLNDEGISNSIWPTMSQAKNIAIVDPYFQVTTTRYASPLILTLQKMHSAGAREKVVHIHCRNGGEPDRQAFSQNILALFENRIPESFKIKIFEWERRQGGPNFHVRCVLCDCGGIQSDAGFGSSNAGDVTLMTLLSTPTIEAMLSRFNPESPAYELCRPPITIFDDCTIDFG